MSKATGPLSSVMIAALAAVSCSSGQRADPAFRAIIPTPPSHPSGEGPTVWIDEAHNNGVRTAGRYEPFVRVLEADGFVVRVNPKAS